MIEYTYIIYGIIVLLFIIQYFVFKNQINSLNKSLNDVKTTSLPGLINTDSSTASLLSQLSTELAALRDKASPTSEEYEAVLNRIKELEEEDPTNANEAERIKGLINKTNILGQIKSELDSLDSKNADVTDFNDLKQRLERLLRDLPKGTTENGLIQAMLTDINTGKTDIAGLKTSVEDLTRITGDELTTRFDKLAYVYVDKAAQNLVDTTQDKALLAHNANTNTNAHTNLARKTSITTDIFNYSNNINLISSSDIYKNYQNTTNNLPPTTMELYLIKKDTATNNIKYYYSLPFDETLSNNRFQITKYDDSRFASNKIYGLQVLNNYDNRINETKKFVLNLNLNFYVGALGTNQNAYLKLSIYSTQKNSSLYNNNDSTKINTYQFDSNNSVTTVCSQIIPIDNDHSHTLNISFSLQTTIISDDLKEYFIILADARQPEKTNESENKLLRFDREPTDTYLQYKLNRFSDKAIYNASYNFTLYSVGI